MKHGLFKTPVVPECAVTGPGWMDAGLEDPFSGTLFASIVATIVDAAVCGTRRAPLLLLLNIITYGSRRLQHTLDPHAKHKVIKGSR